MNAILSTPTDSAYFKVATIFAALRSPIMALHWSAPLTHPMLVSNPNCSAELLTLGCAASFIAAHVPPRTRDGEALSVVTAFVQAAQRARTEDVLLACIALEDLLRSRGYDVEVVGRKSTLDDETDARDAHGWISPLVINLVNRLASLGR